MGSGIVESGLFRSERYELEERTSDPASYSEGEAWIRTDVAPDTDQIATLRFDDGGSTIDIPIYDSAASADSEITKARRVRVNGVTGFIPMIQNGGAYNQLRMQHNGAWWGFHDSLSAIPDSVVSRPADDNTGQDKTAKHGEKFSTSQKWQKIQARISSNNNGFTTAYLTDNSNNTIQSVDVSSLSPGDVVTFDNAGLSANTTYRVMLDAGGNSWDYGELTSASHPYTSSDGNLTLESAVSPGRSIDRTDLAFAIEEIGNINL